MSVLDRLASAVSNVNERAWGAVVRLVPVRADQYSGIVADPDRTVHETRGTMSREPSQPDFEGNRRGTQMQGAGIMAARTHSLVIARDRVPAIGWEPRQYDRVLMVASGEKFEVLLVSRTDTDDLILTLNPTRTFPP